MKKFLSLILALGMVASLAACGGSSSSGDASSDSSTDSSDSAPAASAKLRFVTGGESGTYYAFGSVIAQHATNNTNVAVTGLVGNGSKSNVEELADGNAELAFCQSDVMAYAYNGTNLFEQPIDCFSTVAALYMEDVQIVTTDPSIKTVADLAGKNVSVGAAGSGVYFNAVDILSAYGLGDLDAEGKFTKINATYQSFGDSADSLKDGKIDAAFIVAGAPTTAVVDLSTSADVYIINIDDEHSSKLMEDYPFYTKTTIPAGTYDGQEEDAQTVSVRATLIASNELSEDVVYELVKAMFDNKDELVAGHEKFNNLKLEEATAGISVPFHPGAVKYFQEQNIEVK